MSEAGRSTPSKLSGMAGIDYQYSEARADESHAYLFPIISRMLASIPHGSTVLDLGCGNGSFLSMFQDRNWRLIGTDYSPTGIAIAKAAHPEIEFFLADAQLDLSRQVGEVDVVISTEVIEHLYDPKAFLRNANRLLKSGGTLLVTTPYHGYLKNLMLAATARMDRHFTALWDHGHIKFWSRHTLTEAVKQAGFTVQEFQGAGGFPFLWKSMVMKGLK